MGKKPLPSRGGVGGGAEPDAPANLQTLPHPNPSPEGEGLDLVRAARLLTPVSPTPRLDAELLLAHALGINREALLLGPSRPAPTCFDAIIQRRLAHEPVAYITGEKAFWTLDLHVTPDVLIPRPDSETLIEAALAHFAECAPASILDLGTGSGALLLAAQSEWRHAFALGVDRSAAALAVARGNTDRLGLKAHFIQGDWAAAIEGRFDLVLCNPPYVESGAELSPDVREHEPHTALFAGADGLDEYRRLAPELGRLIAPGGIAAVEIGATQAQAVSALFTSAGLRATVRKDLGARARCLIVAPD